MFYYINCDESKTKCENSIKIERKRTNPVSYSKRNLCQYGKYKYSANVFVNVTGMVCAISDEPSKNRKRKSSNNAQEDKMWKEKNANMVNYHGNYGNPFKLRN